MKRRYNVRFRLDGVLVEVKGVLPVAADRLGNTLLPLEGALKAARRMCLAQFTTQYKGMTLEHLNGDPQVVGVETPDAWDD